MVRRADFTSNQRFLNAARAEALEFIAAGLHRTGQFQYVDIGAAFPQGYPDRDALNEQRQRHIIARKKPEFCRDQQETYMIMVHANKMNLHLARRKRQAAHDNGLFTVNVPYKFLRNEGDFFRRAIVPSIADSERVRAPEKPGYSKRSIEDYPRRFREAVVDMSEFDRKFVDYGAYPVYYQPKSARLDELLLRVQWEDVTACYPAVPALGIPETSQTLVKWKHPHILEEMKAFTVVPWRYDPVRIGNFMMLPDVDYALYEQARLAHKIGELRSEVVRASGYGAAVRAAIDGDEYKRLYVAAEGLGLLGLTHRHALEALAGPSDANRRSDAPVEWTPDGGRILKLTYDSESRPGLTHTTTLTYDPDQLDDIAATCSCEGQRYWRRCWHVTDALEFLDTITSMNS